jgi:hypothetical protein
MALMDSVLQVPEQSVGEDLSAMLQRMASSVLMRMASKAHKSGHNDSSANMFSFLADWDGWTQPSALVF